MRSWILSIAIVCKVAVFSQSAPITIDGCFDDWTPGSASFNDVPETQSGVDILSMQVSNDAENLFIKLVLDTELDLIDGEVPHDLYLQLDTDNDPATGFSLQGGTFGSELGVQLMARSAFYNVIPFSTVDLHDIGYRQGPTVTSTTFEIALDRSAIPDGLNPLFPSSTIGILVRESGGDEMPNFGSSFTYTFDATPVPFVPLTLDKGPMSDLRVGAFNVENDGLIDVSRVPSFERLVKALDADIIGFSECYSTTAGDVKSLLDSWLPLGTANGWYVIKDDFELITASRWPISNSWPSAFRQFPVLIDLPASYGTDLLFTNAHLSCCTNDAGRQAQVDEYAAFIHDAKSAGGLIDLPFGTPFVYGGDLNLVGFSQQLNTLISGNIQDVATWGQGAALDWDGTVLTDAKPRLTHQPMTYTWENLGSSYPPGRLDFMIHSDAVLDMDKAFVLNTNEMPAAELVANGLLASDNTSASDHLPVICDYTIVPPSVQLSVKAFLQGPFDGVSMNDDLRVASLIPLNEPYTSFGFAHFGGGGEATIPSVLNVAGPDAVVDWVVVALRSKLDNTQVLATRSALLQRDGDVVDIDGTSALSIEVLPDDYYVSLHHRNHLGVVTNSTVTLGVASTQLDFSAGSVPIFGVDPLVNVANTWCLWSGNAVMDDWLKYLGSANDRDAVLVEIGGSVPTNTVSNVYSVSDLNMDGIVKYTGSDNDRDVVLVNIGGSVPTATRIEQLP
jgi:hypothetical protein